MLLQQFPDLTWIRIQSKTGFAQGRSPKGKTLPKKEWPNVSLWVDSTPTERTKITGTLSLFINLKGNGWVQTEGRELQVQQQSVALSNMGAEYNLLLPKGAETLNFHFGPSLVRNVIQGLSNSDKKLLDGPFATSSSSYHTYPRTLWMQGQLQDSIHQIRRFYAHFGNTNPEREEELLISLLSSLLQTDLDSQPVLQNNNLATRQEMGKRLIWALDFIHGHSNRNFTLDQLAQAACLSKYHLIRCFQKAYGLTPFQYTAKLKADRAQQLVQDPQWEIQQIGTQLGFSEAAAFSRFFKSHFGSTPSAYRKSNLGQVRS